MTRLDQRVDLQPTLCYIRGYRMGHHAATEAYRWDFWLALVMGLEVGAVAGAALTWLGGAG